MKIVQNGWQYECSECGGYIGEYLEEIPEWDYCPWCGERIEARPPYTDWEAKMEDDAYDDRVAMEILERER